MKTTYYIEDYNGEIINYYGLLRMAKDALVKLGCPGDYRIVCLKGQYKYEGRHDYYLLHDGTKFYKGDRQKTATKAKSDFERKD